MASKNNPKNNNYGDYTLSSDGMITLTMPDGKAITFTVEQATGVVTTILAARKAGYDFARNTRIAERAARAEERKQQRETKAKAKVERNAARVAKLPGAARRTHRRTADRCRLAPLSRVTPHRPGTRLSTTNREAPEMNEYKFKYKYHRGAHEVTRSVKVRAATLTQAEDLAEGLLNQKHPAGWYFISVTKVY